MDLLELAVVIVAYGILGLVIVVALRLIWVEYKGLIAIGALLAIVVGIVWGILLALRWVGLLNP